MRVFPKDISCHIREQPFSKKQTNKKENGPGTWLANTQKDFDGMGMEMRMRKDVKFGNVHLYNEFGIYITSGTGDTKNYTVVDPQIDLHPLFAQNQH